MTLRGADLRFVLPHPVEAAALLLPREDGRLRALHRGLEAAGIRTDLGWPSAPRPWTVDLVVAAAQDAQRALQVPARAHLLLGRLRASRVRGHPGLPLLVRGAVTRPETVVPLSPPQALRYYLSRISSPPTATGRLRNRAYVAVTRTPVPPDLVTPGPALVTVVTDGAGPALVPALVRAAHELGVPPDTQWVLALGRGDDLQRSVFHLVHEGRRRWVLKFARVSGASASLARDEAGIALVQKAGGTAAAHAPTHLGRLSVAGHRGSVESAAPGRPLLELLGKRPLPLIDRIADWVVRVGVATAAPAAALHRERSRIERDVMPAWRGRGAPADLVERVPDVPAVLQHNDLGTWNVLSDGRDFMAVDWESARAAGMPLWDLCYFLADALPRLEGPAGPDTYLARTLALFTGHSPHSGRLFGWIREAVRALQIPPAAVGPIVTLGWLHHGLSAGARTRALTTSEAAPLGHLALLGDRWLTHPALGPSWSAWAAG